MLIQKALRWQPSQKKQQYQNNEEKLENNLPTRKKIATHWVFFARPQV